MVENQLKDLEGGLEKKAEPYYSDEETVKYLELLDRKENLEQVTAQLHNGTKVHTIHALGKIRELRAKEGLEGSRKKMHMKL